jgi:hypothetical protein
MQDSEDDFEGTLVVLFHRVDRDTPPVIDNGYRPVFIDHYGYKVTIAGEGFVNRVVYHFIDKMVQPAGVCTADIHCRALTDRSEPFENRYMGRIVGFSHAKPPLKSGKNTVQ